MGKIKLPIHSYKINIFFSPWIKPLILMLFIKLDKQKKKMAGKISNMNGKIQIEVKDLITNHSKSVSDSILLAALIFPSC